MWPRCACGDKEQWFALKGKDIVCKWCDHFYRKEFECPSTNGSVAAAIPNQSGHVSLIESFDQTMTVEASFNGSQGVTLLSTLKKDEQGRIWVCPIVPSPAKPSTNG